ncbi:glycosyltransferase family 39 protein [Streptomyces chiangmaiensis]|uniref:Glycosyltransferase family 39 protein n=1 Tax=Streptomyces chiangmaiensis TaxID=766497 RepID=A0ABU7FME4_9ACTN|nr:glycosyltransferase family 39 protein [Streptomyces chiangmaiensis]MED7825121.1 glycosyltransferase family 39 protein [Streptomyces chiangmaiensis]
MSRLSERRTECLAVLVPVVVMLAIGLWGLDRGGMWRDEAVTFQVARRSVPQIWHLLGSVDAVHGLYYLLMHMVLAVHPGEVLLRLPSVCGAVAATGLVAALGTRLCRPRVGLWAGLLYAVTPMVGHYAQEGRSYALVAAGVVGATLLLVRAVRGGRWWPYGVVLAVTCLLHEFAVLVLLAHACTLALARVPWTVWQRWGCAAGAVVAVLLPLVLVSWGQAEQVAWLAAPDGRSVEQLLERFAGPSPVVLGPYLVLIALAGGMARSKRDLSPAGVALPLMVIPPAVLMGVSQVSPLYDDRYVLYALAGAPLLAAAGAERVAGVLSRLRTGHRRVPTVPRQTSYAGGVAAGGPLLPAPRGPAGHGGSIALRHAPRMSTSRSNGAVPPSSWVRYRGGALLGVLTVCAVLLVQFPLLRADRRADHRPDDLAGVSALVGRQVRPGDPVLFLPSLERRSALAYPAGFGGVRDVALDMPAAEDGTLYGREVGPRELRRRLGGLTYVWVVSGPFAPGSTWTPPNPTERAKLALVTQEFIIREEYVRRGVTLRLYVRREAPRPAV